MKPNILILSVLLFSCSYSLLAQDQDISSAIQQDQQTEGLIEEAPKETPKETISKEIKVISIDILSAPEDGHVIIADPIKLSIDHILNLSLRSSVYPNEYPHDMLGGLATSKALLSNKFKISSPDNISISSVLQCSPSEYSDEVIENWKPIAVGRVVLEFYGDLVVKPGSTLGKGKKVRHVIVQVPVKVVASSRL